MMDKDETDYEVQENHSLARGIWGGAMLVGIPLAVCAYYGVNLWWGWVSSVGAVACWDFCRYRG